MPIGSKIVMFIRTACLWSASVFLVFLTGLWIRSMTVEDEISFQCAGRGVRVLTHFGSLWVRVCTKPIWTFHHRARIRDTLFDGSRRFLAFGASSPDSALFFSVLLKRSPIRISYPFPE